MDVFTEPSPFSWVREMLQLLGCIVFLFGTAFVFFFSRFPYAYIVKGLCLLVWVICVGALAYVLDQIFTHSAMWTHTPDIRSVFRIDVEDLHNPYDPDDETWESDNPDDNPDNNDPEFIVDFENLVNSEETDL